MDTTLVDFSDMKWVRGDIAFIYNGDAGEDADLAVLDNQVQALSQKKICEHQYIHYTH